MLQIHHLAFGPLSVATNQDQLAHEAALDKSVGAGHAYAPATNNANTVGVGRCAAFSVGH